MKILPDSRMGVSVEDVVSGFNFAPKSGDVGHVEDHEVLSKVMFDVPQTAVSLGTAYRNDGQWSLWRPVNLSGEPQPVSFAQVREFVERAGATAIAGVEHAAADGETDYLADSESLEGIYLHIFASGVVGLTHAVADLIQQVNDLRAAAV